MAASYKMNVVEDLLANFSGLTNKPEKFLSIQTSLSDNLRNTTKTLYDFIKSIEEDGEENSEALPELIVDQFDEEQIWQEIELQNKPSINHVIRRSSQILVGEGDVGFGLRTSGTKSAGEGGDTREYHVDDSVTDVGESLENDSDKDSHVGDDGDLEELKERLGLKNASKWTIGNPDDSEDSDFAGFEEYEPEQDDEKAPSGGGTDEEESGSEGKPKGRLKKRKTVVDDKFFKMADMETFLEREDAKFEQEGRERGKDDDDGDDDDEIEVDLGEEQQNFMYKDFFDEPEDTHPSKKVKFTATDHDTLDRDMSGSSQGDLLASDSSDGEAVEDILGGKREEKSSYEKRQERLKSKIKEMEEANIAEKPWQLSGEATASARPENSLLEEVLDFEHTTKLPPVITEETTKSLEDLIKQRIKDKAFDDVERKVKPTENPIEYKKRIVLDQEKSKKSLGELYEEEYLKKQKADESDDEVDAQHEEIKDMMQTLFIKLDALSNFHYTPKPAAPEVKIVSNMPSISMEEVAPVAVSDAALLAPEEIQEKQKGEMKGKTERSETDRKRERREKRAAKRARREERERRQKLVEKMNPGLGNKYSKEKAMERLERDSKGSKNISVIKGDKTKNSLTSSKVFFSQLQDEVTAQIKNRKEKSTKKKDKIKDSQKFKL